MKPFNRPNVKYVYQMPQDKSKKSYQKRNLRYTQMDMRDDDELTPKLE